MKIKNFASNINENEFIEQNNKVIFEGTDIEIKGFKKFFEKFPIFIKEGNYYDIEIALKARQIGTGLQSMIYVCIKMSKVYDCNGKRCSFDYEGNANRYIESILNCFKKTQSRYIKNFIGNSLKG